jgi:hypothetical protein
MAGAELATLSNILKEYYMGPVVDQLNKEVLLLGRLESRSEDLVGKRAYVPLTASRTTGIGARAENGTLPVAGNQTYEKAVYDLKYLYGKASVTGPSMAKTKSEAGAFLQALKSELDGLRVDLRKDLARQIYGDGTGVIAGVASIAAVSSSQQVITLDANATSGYIADEGKEALNKGQLYVGMLISINDGSNTVVSGGSALIIKAMNPATPSITVAAINVSSGAESAPALATTGNTAWVILRYGVTQQASAGAGEVSSLSAEVDGLARIVSTGNFGGIDASTNTWWQAQSVTPEATANASGTRAVSFDDIQKALNKVRVAGGTPTAIVTSLGVQREIYSLFQTGPVYTENIATPDYSAGFRTLTYAGLPIVADIDAPYGTMYILDESTLKVFSDQDFHFLDADGQTLRQAGDKDAFEAVMVRYMNMGATRRNNQCVMTNIAVDGAFDLGF